jgi:hypothetical protein
MHRALSALALLCIASAVVAATASAASTPTDRKVAALAKQVTALQKQVTALQKQVKTLNPQLTALKKASASEQQGISAIAVLTLCSAAVTADAFTGTWNIIDQIAGPQPKFGVQPLIDDKGACAAFNLTRSQAIPPSVALYQAIVALGGQPSPFFAWNAIG